MAHLYYTHTNTQTHKHTSRRKRIGLVGEVDDSSTVGEKVQDQLEHLIVSESMKMINNGNIVKGHGRGEVSENGRVRTSENSSIILKQLAKIITIVLSQNSEINHRLAAIWEVFAQGK